MLLAPSSFLKKQFILFDRSIGDLDIQSVDGGGWKLLVLWKTTIANPIASDRPIMYGDVMGRQSLAKTYCVDPNLQNYLIPVGTPLSNFRELMVVNNNTIFKSVFGRWIITSLLDNTAVLTKAAGINVRMENGRSTQAWPMWFGWFDADMPLTQTQQCFGIWDRPNNSGPFGGSGVCGNLAAAALLPSSQGCHFDQTLVKGLFVR